MNFKLKDIVPQLVTVLAVVLIFGFFTYNAQVNMENRGITFGYGFLSQESSFDVQFSLIEYDGSHSYFRAYLVGLLNTILVSVKDNKNINILIKKIKDKLSNKFTSNNSTLITRQRHRTKLNECLKEIDNFMNKDHNKDIELAAEDLRMATRHLGSIVGKVDVEEILGSIFKDFCIGK